MQWHWRHSAEQGRIFGLDASIFLPVVLILIWPAKGHWSFVALLWGSVVMVVAIAIFARRGYTPTSAVLLARAKFAQWVGRGLQPVGVTYHSLHARLYRDRTDR